MKNMIFLPAPPCCLLVLTPSVEWGPPLLSAAVWNAPSFLSAETYMKDPPSLEYLTCQFKGSLGVENTWRNVFLFKWWDSESSPQAQVLNIWKLLWCLSTSWQAWGLGTCQKYVERHQSSVSENDGHFQDQFPEWFAQIQLVQIRILFLRLRKFMGTEDDTQVSWSFLFLSPFSSSPQFPVKSVIKSSPSETTGNIKHRHG